jgi:hypothetical protein
LDAFAASAVISEKGKHPNHEMETKSPANGKHLMRGRHIVTFFITFAYPFTGVAYVSLPVR